MVAGKSAESLLSQVAPGGSGGGGVQHKALQYGMLDGGSVNFGLDLVGLAMNLRVPTTALEGSSYTCGLPGRFIGVDNAQARLNISGGGITGGEITGTLSYPVISGDARFAIDGDGAVSGSIERPWNIPALGSGNVELGVRSGGLAGTATLSPTEVSAAGVTVTGFTGEIGVAGMAITASGSGDANIANNMVAGSFDLTYAQSNVTGNMTGTINLPDMLAAYGSAGGAPPQLSLEMTAAAWSGTLDTTLPINAPGITGQPSLNLGYDSSAGFSGTGAGEFDVAQFISGSATVSVSSAGGIGGTLSATTTDLAVGPIQISGISLSANLDGGLIGGSGTASVSGVGDAVSGSVAASFDPGTGMSVTPTIAINLPVMEGASLSMGYDAASGFSGSATISPSLPALGGQATVSYDAGNFGATGRFDINLPIVSGASIEVGYADGNLTGQAAIDAGAFSIGSVIQVTSSSISAGLGESFTFGGSASVSMAGGLVTGDMAMNYDGGLTGSIDALFSPPGITPVNLHLAYAGGQFSGSATTKVAIPFTKGCDLTIGYANGQFSGNARAELEVPFIESGSVQITVDTDGTITGTVQVAANDVSIPPLAVSGMSVTGSIASSGDLNLNGTGTVTGIPMVEQANVTMGVHNGAFSGSVEAVLNIPTMKSTSATITLHEDGHVSGAADVECEIAGVSGAVHAEYDNGAFFGTGTLGYSKGKFSGSIEAAISREGEVSGTGRVSYAITDDLTVTGEVTLRPDGTMIVGGELECPDRIALFEKDWEKEIFSMTGRFGIPGLSIQLPIVGVIGLEAQLSGSLSAYAKVGLYLADITARGTFDTATDVVDLEVGGRIVGSAEAGIEAAARLAVGLGIGPAFIGGYVEVAGRAGIQAEVGAGVNAHYNSGTDVLGLDLDVNASAALNFDLTISGGITAKVDLWLVEWEKDWELASKTWSYNPGVNFDYNPSFSFNLGDEPPDSMLEPSSPPAVDGNAMATQAAGQSGDGGGSGAGTTLQRKADGSGKMPKSVSKNAEAGTSGPGRSMPHLDKIQPAFGNHDVSGVKAHTDSRAADANKAMGSKAFATGNDVAFANNSPDLHTAAHEAAHTVQQRAGVHTKNGVGAVGDKYEQHADAVANAVVAGKSAEPLLNQVAGPATSGGSSAVQHKLDGPVQFGRLDGGSVNFNVNLGGISCTVRVPTSELEGRAYTTALPSPLMGVTNAQIALTISGGGITGGTITGDLNYPVISGRVSFSVDGDGNVSGSITRPWNIPGLGNGDIELSVVNGGLSGTATLAPTQVNAIPGATVSALTGSLTVVGTTVSATGSGTASIAGGMLTGAFNVGYANGNVTGDIDGAINIPDFSAAFANGAAGVPALPKLAVNLASNVFTGTVSVGFPAQAPGITGFTTLDLSYSTASGFSGTGTGTFDIANFINGTTSVTVASAGGVSGTFTASVTDFTLGPISVSAIGLTASLSGGLITGSANATVSGMNDVITGSLAATLSGSGGLAVTPTVSVNLPAMRNADLALGYDAAAGFSGSATIRPSVAALGGEATVGYAAGAFTASGGFDLNSPFLQNARVDVTYGSEKITGEATLGGNEMTLAGVVVSGSQVKAKFDNALSVEGSATVSAGNGMLAGTLTGGWVNDDIDINATGTVNPPGLASVPFTITKVGSAISGTASTDITLPRVQAKQLTVNYDGTAWTGGTAITLDIPFLENASGDINVGNDGVSGSFAITANSFNFNPLTVSGASVQGTVGTDGSVALAGSATVAGGMPGLTGTATVAFNGEAVTASGGFGFASSMISGQVNVAYANDRLTGHADIAPTDMSLGPIAVTQSTITAALAETFTMGGSANISVAGGLLTGSIAASWTGSDINASGSATFSPTGIEPVTLTLAKEGDSISGSAAATVNIPMVKNGARVTAAYSNNRFSGGAQLELDVPIVDNARGSIELTPEGHINGSITVEASNITLPFLNVDSATVTAGIEDGGMNLGGSAVLSTRGIPMVKGTANLNFQGSNISASGNFDIESSFFKQGRIGVSYNDGVVEGTGTIVGNDINLPMLTVTNSTVNASIGREFAIGGSAQVTAAGNLFSGTLTASYARGDVDASVAGTFSPPGISPIAFNLAKQGENVTGSATTDVNVPFTKGGRLTVTYNNGAFGGRADLDLDIPFVESGKAWVEVTEAGHINGGIEVNAGNIKLPFVTVNSATVTGSITDGVFAMEGSGSISGIPMCNSAEFMLGVRGGNYYGSGAVELDIPMMKKTRGEVALNEDGTVSGSIAVEAEISGCTGAVTVNYNDGKISGTGTLGYSKGPFRGSVTANLSEEGKISGSGRVSYDITPDFTITAQVDLREDGSMKIGGKIECPDKVDLFEQSYEKEIFSFLARFGIPGLSIQLPIVGVVGLEARLSGSLSVYASLGLYLTDIVAEGSFDTLTDNVELDLGGTIKGRAEAGILAELEFAFGLGIGPAFIGGYIKAKGKAAIFAEMAASIAAHYSSNPKSLGLDIDLSASAGLIFGLELEAGLKAEIDLWLFSWSAEFPMASKSFEYAPGVNFDYNPKFGYDLIGGGTPSPDEIAPAEQKTMDNNDGKDVGGKGEIDDSERYDPCRNVAEKFDLDTEDEYAKGVKALSADLPPRDADRMLGRFGGKIAGFMSGSDLAVVAKNFAGSGANLAAVLNWVMEAGVSGNDVTAIILACTNEGYKTEIINDDWKGRICGMVTAEQIGTIVDHLKADLETKCRWMIMGATNYGLVKPRVEAAPQGERDVMRTEEWMGIFTGLFSLTDVGTLVDLLGGDLTFKWTWLFAASTDYAHLLEKASAAPQGERDACRGDQWKGQVAGVTSTDNMAELVDVLGGDLHFKWDWMFAASPKWDHIAAKAEAAPQGERDACRNDVWRGLMCATIAVDEMALLVDILGGDLDFKWDWMFTQGTTWGHIEEKANNAPQAERDACRSDAWKPRVVGAVALAEMDILVDILGGDLAWKLDWMYALTAGFDLVTVKVDNAPQPERDAVRNDSWKGRFLGAHIHDEIFILVDQLAGNLHEKIDWIYDAGTSYGAVREKIVNGPGGEYLLLDNDFWMNRMASVTGPPEMHEVTGLLGWNLENSLKWMFNAGTTWDLARDKIINFPGEHADMLGNAKRVREIESTFTYQEMAAAVELLGRIIPSSSAVQGAGAGAMEAAWGASSPFPGDPKSRHEEGGWFYMNLLTGSISVATTKGDQSSINLGGAPEQADSVVVGYFHTHPNPSTQPDENGVVWQGGPSSSDLGLAAAIEVPAFVRSDTGITAYGPGQRPHLTGPKGLPGSGATTAPQDRVDQLGKVEQKRHPMVDKMIKISTAGGKWEDVRLMLRSATAGERAAVAGDLGVMKWLAGLAPDVPTLMHLMSWEKFAPKATGAKQDLQQTGLQMALEQHRAEQLGKVEQGKPVPGEGKAKADLKKDGKKLAIKLGRLASKKKINKRIIWTLITEIVDNWAYYMRADLKPEARIVKEQAAIILTVTKDPLRPWFDRPAKTGKVLDKTIKKCRMFLKTPKFIGKAEEGDVQKKAGSSIVLDQGSTVETAAQGVGGAGGAFPYAAQIQQSFGSHDIGGVRAHQGSEASQAASAIGAQAYAMGNQVAFAGSTNLQVAAHEAAHVVQQRAGAQVSGSVGQAGDRWEQHADQVAAAVVAGQSAQGLLDQIASAGSGAVASQSVQRVATPPTTTTTPAPAAATATPAAVNYTITYKSETFDAPTGDVGESASNAITSDASGVKINGKSAADAMKRGEAFEAFLIDSTGAGVVTKAAEDAAKKYADAKSEATKDEAKAKAADDAADVKIAELKAALLAVTPKTAEAISAKLGSATGTKKLTEVDSDAQTAGVRAQWKAGVVKRVLDGEGDVYAAQKAETSAGGTGVYIAIGTPIPDSEIAADTAKGVSRVVPLSAIFSYNLSGATKAKFMNNEAYFIAAVNEGLYDPCADLTGNISGGNAIAWWFPSAKAPNTNVKDLIKDLALEGRYTVGMVRFSVDVAAAKANLDLHKPTAFDGMPFAEFVVDNSEVWGTTAGSTPEAVAPEVPVATAQATLAAGPKSAGDLQAFMVAKEASWVDAGHAVAKTVLNDGLGLLDNTKKTSVALADTALVLKSELLAVSDTLKDWDNRPLSVDSWGPVNVARAEQAVRDALTSIGKTEANLPGDDSAKNAATYVANRKASWTAGSGLYSDAKKIVSENIFDNGDAGSAVSLAMVNLYKVYLGEGHDDYAIDPASVEYSPCGPDGKTQKPTEDVGYTLKYKTINGQEFTATVAASGVPTSISSHNLNLKATGGPQLRANTVQDAGSRRLNEGQHNSHLIADEFRGSGFKPSANVATTSGIYNADVIDGKTMRWAELQLGNWLETGIDPLKVPEEFSLTVDVAWWPLDQVDPAFITAVNADAKHYANIEEPTDRVSSKEEIEAKINEYKQRHPTTKLQRIAGMSYSAEVTLDNGSTVENEWDIGPDIWLAIFGG